MNDESPFRISSMLLTVACLVCGVSAVVFVLPRYIQRTKSVDHSTAAGELQLNLAEFHAAQPQSAPELDPPQPPVRRTLLPASTAIPQKRNIGVDITSGTPSEPHRAGATGSVQTTSSNFIESTVVNRHAHQWTSRGDSVPQFYAPVTVHPVTVNIDNTGIIQEISRVHERLDSFASEKAQFEKEVFARIEDTHSESANSEVPVPAETSRTSKPQRIVERLKISEPPVRKSHEIVLRQPSVDGSGGRGWTERSEGSPGVSGYRPPTPATHQSMADNALVPEPVVKLPVKFQSDMPADQTPEVPTPVAPTPVAPTSIAPTSIAPTPVEPTPNEPIPIAPTPVDSKPEVEFELEAEPQTVVPEVPLFELPPARSEAADLQTATEFEFSPEPLPVPSPVTVTPEISTVVEFEAAPVEVVEPVAVAEHDAVAEPVAVLVEVAEHDAVAEPTIISEPVVVPEAIEDAEPFQQLVSAFEMAQVTTTSDMPTAIPQTEEFPVLPDLTSPGLQWAKRTTDPPFMNGIVARRAAPASAIGSKTRSKVQQVSHSVEASKQPVKPSNPTCQNCTKSSKKPSHKTKSAAPPSPIQRLRSLFK